MANSASCSSSSAAAAPFSKILYDVFISFRGEDTRRSFTSHLYAALYRNQIRAYKDDTTLEKGDEVWPALVHAIENSYLCLVVFSKEYAFSTWCLKELTHILDCKKEKQVVPVFYQISPRQVRKQAGSYEEAFQKHKDNPKCNEEVVQKWRYSLEKAANVSGFDSESKEYRDDYHFIESIVKDVFQKLKHIYPQTEPEGLVGINKNCADIELLLREFQSIGLWGMSGLGKTTIARVVFNKYSSEYEGYCFLENVRENSGKLGVGLSGLRKKLFSQLLKREIDHIDAEYAFVEKRLADKTVFIVLDDVDALEQIEYLVRNINCFGLGSRIIITTRDKHVLKGKVDKIHQVKGLDFHQSLQLFSLNAFDSDLPQMGFEELSRRVVIYANGLPLALKLLGSFLHSRSKEAWESALRKLKRHPYKQIENVLKLSYDGLDDEEKEIFLDIAFFFKGSSKESVENFLNACNFCATIGLEALQDKAFITISKLGIVEMHNLIQEMGWERVREKCIKYPGRHSRLRDPQEIYDVLQNNKGTHLVEGIILDISKGKDLYLNEDTFTKMNNLRFLKIYNGIESLRKVHIPLGLKSISHKLRYFQWNACPLPCLPSGFCAEMLVELHMPNSRLKKLWDGVQNLINLKEIDLRGSKELMELPDFSNATNLEWINLSYCTNLCHIHPSLLCLQLLGNLVLSGCQKLRSLQSKIHLRSLYYLSVKGCLTLKEISLSSENLDYLSFEGCSNLKVFSLSSEKIKQLDFRDTAVELLLSSVGSCRTLERLYFKDSLKKLPNELSNLKCLKDLGIYNCSQLDTWNLHVILDGLCSLELLELSNCFNLRQLPCSLGLLVRLKRLVLDGSSVESLPTSINHLRELKTLSLQHCRRLGCLPKLPPSIELLNAINCTSLETMATSMESEFRSSCTINFINCVKLNEESINNLEAYIDFRIKQVAASKIYYSGSQFCFPGNKIPKCFICGTRQRWITIALPSCSNLLGFAFCVVISNDRMPPNSDAYTSRIDCECYFEGRKVGVCQSNYWLEPFDFRDPHNMRIISDHVCLWYYHNSSGAILKAIQEIRANGQPTNLNPVVSFQFSVLAVSCVSGWKLHFINAIKMCGVWPIYASEEMEVSLGYKTNKCDLMERPTKKLKPSLLTKGIDLELGTKSYRYEDIDKSEVSISGIAVGGSEFHHEMHDFTKINLLNRVRSVDASECHDSINETQLNLELEFGLSHKSKRCEYDLEADEQKLPPTKNFIQPDPLGLKPELVTNTKTYVYDEGIEVGGFHHDNQLDKEQLVTDSVRKNNLFNENIKGESDKRIVSEYQNSTNQMELALEACEEHLKIEEIEVGNSYHGSQDSLLQTEEFIFQPSTTPTKMHNHYKNLSGTFSRGSFIGMAVTFLLLLIYATEFYSTNYLMLWIPLNMGYLF